MPHRSTPPMLLPVLAFCARDVSLAQLTLELCYKLDGQVNATLALAHDIPTPPALQAAAERAFARVIDITFDPPPRDAIWPVPQNHAWQHTARHLAARWPVVTSPGWLWLETDAVPLRAGWLAKLTSLYISGLKPFAGHACSDLATPFYLNGVAIYPPNVIDPLANCSALYSRSYAFDRMAGECIRRAGWTDLSRQILHHTKDIGSGPGRPFDAASLTTLLSSPDALLFHGCTDGSLQNLLLGTEHRPLPVTPRAPAQRSVFYHSGDLGDIIYSLPAMRELGGGDLHLGPDNRTNMMTREKMTTTRAALLTPLLEAQPYVYRASFSATLPTGTQYDFNQMRHLLRSERLDMQPGFNLARCYLKAFGLALDNDTMPWLTVPPKTKAPVVIARSPRYQNPTFRWDRILREYRGQIVFIGSPDEHAAFTRAWGPVLYEPTATLLDAAALISGCRLFIGNQSVPYAIAEGLKRPAILEACPAGSNTLFQRPDAIVGCTDATILPVLGGKPRPRKLKPKDALTISGPCDTFTGLGRLTCQIATEFASRGRAIALDPLSRHKTLPPAVSKLIATPKPSAPRLVITPLLDAAKTVQPNDTVFTMWESTRLPVGAVETLNQRASSILVPTAWCASVFSANGIIVPLHIVPLGVDSAIYRPNRKPSNTLLFGAAARLAHGGKRKGIEDVIEAFTLAFPAGDEPALLHIKLFADSTLPPPSDKRITIIADTVSDAWMAEWYNKLSCFISLARGEGWGLHVHEALACGTPVIAPAFSGLSSLVPTSPLRYRITEASEGYMGHWCQPDVGHAAELMRAGEFTHPTVPLPTPSDTVNRILEALS